MEKVGKLLQEERQKQKLTLEEISKRTRITLSQLKAIEEGDIDFFKNDISYIKFYIKSYASTLGIAYDELKDQVDQFIAEYTQSVTQKNVEEKKEMEQSIQRKAKKVDGNIPIRVEKKKRDYSLVILLSIVVVLVGSLGFVFVNYILPGFNNSNSPLEDGTVLIEGDKESEGISEIPVINEEKELEIIQMNSKNYEIIYYTEAELIDLQITFGSNSWIQVYYDDVESSNPQARVYSSGEVVEVLAEAKDELKISIHFGYLKSNSIKINGLELLLDDSIKDSTNGVKLNFVLVKGEQ